MVALALPGAGSGNLRRPVLTALVSSSGAQVSYRRLAAVRVDLADRLLAFGFFGVLFLVARLLVLAAFVVLFADADLAVVAFRVRLALVAFVAALLLFRDFALLVRLAGADPALAFSRRFLRAPIRAPETAPIKVPTTGVPKGRQRLGWRLFACTEMAKKAMPNIRMLSAVMMVATGSVLGGFAARAEPGGLGIVPETRGIASTVIPAHEPAMVGYQCVWLKGASTAEPASSANGCCSTARNATRQCRTGQAALGSPRVGKPNHSRCWAADCSAERARRES